MDDDDLDGAALMDLGRVMELGGNLDGAVQMYERAAEGTGTLISVRVGGKAFPKTARLVPGPLDAILALARVHHAGRLATVATSGAFVRRQKTSVEYLERAARRGSTEAMDALGHAYYEGHGVPRDRDVAEAIWETSRDSYAWDATAEVAKHAKRGRPRAVAPVLPPRKKTKPAEAPPPRETVPPDVKTPALVLSEAYVENPAHPEPEPPEPTAPLLPEDAPAPSPPPTAEREPSPPPREASEAEPRERSPSPEVADSEAEPEPASPPPEPAAPPPEREPSPPPPESDLPSGAAAEAAAAAPPVFEPLEQRRRAPSITRLRSHSVDELIEGLTRPAADAEGLPATIRTFLGETRGTPQA